MDSCQATCRNGITTASYSAGICSFLKKQIWFGSFLGFIFFTGLVVAEEKTCISWSDFDSDGESEMLIQGVPSGGLVQLSGQLVHRPLIIEKEHYWLGFQFYNPQGYLDGQQFDTLVYTVPFAVRINNETKRVEEYVYNAPLNEEDKSKLRNIYKAFHIIGPSPKDNPKDYIVNDFDDIGHFDSKYLYEPDRKMVRTKLNYDKIGWTNSTNSFAIIKEVIIHSDEMNFELNDCWIESIKGENDLEVFTENDFLHLRVKQKISLKQRNDTLPSDLRLLQLSSNPREWEMLSKNEVYPPAKSNPMATSEDFLGTLSGLELSSMPYADLEQLLYDNQIYLHLLKDLLKNGVFNNQDEARLLLMIGIVDVPQSHTLLTEIFLDEEFGNEARFRTLMALKYSKNPLHEKLLDDIFAYSAQPLGGKNAELSHSSMMTLGIVVRNQMNSEFGRELSSRLATELKGSQSIQGKAALLSAIGNSGDSLHEQTVYSYLSDDSSILRERSAKALYHLPSENTLNMLSRSLVSEKEIGTQRAILKSMGPNPMNKAQIDQVYQFALNSEDSDTRKAAILALSMQKEHQVNVKPQLKSLVKKEKSEGNLRAVMRALYKNNK